VFYRWNMNNAKTRIHLLKKNEEGIWETVADVEGYSENVREVIFSDLNGDGFPELLVGWNMYNTTDKRLAVYRIDRKLSTVDFEKAYTELRCADMTDDGAEDVLLVNISSGEQEVKAQLYSYVKNQMQYRGETVLDSGIKQVRSSIVATLSPTVNGMFLDCQKDANTTVTELIYWNNSSLESPLSDEPSNLNTVTARENGLSCKDLDGDGVVEWPLSKRLSGYETAPLETAIWQTDWMAYDFRSAQSERKFSSIVNFMDSYMLRLRDEWNGDSFKITYDKKTHILSIGQTTADRPFLQLLVTHSDTKIALPEGFSYFDGLDTWHYAVWVDTDIVTLEEAQYLFVVL
ncbi:MAG: FG-GAP repeat protein, partial [Clostridia bacterium]|nr:FG-GAP repeat protein [Clostridia bacterium]